jgi:dTDP-glucose 4,6-dehydratase
VVHSSTSEVYGSARRVPIDEQHPLQGQSPYAASKIGADKLAESFYRSYEQPIAIVRPFNTYGPRQSARAVIPAIITQALAGRPVQLGALRPTRDFTFVADTVRGFMLAGEASQAVGRTINLGTGQEIAIGDLARLIGTLLEREIAIVHDESRDRPQQSEVERLCSDNRLARELLGWSPQVPLEAGLRLTIAWLAEHLERYRPERYQV